MICTVDVIHQHLNYTRGSPTDTLSPIRGKCQKWRKNEYMALNFTLMAIIAPTISVKQKSQRHQNVWQLNNNIIFTTIALQKKNKNKTEETLPTLAHVQSTLLLTELASHVQSTLLLTELAPRSFAPPSLCGSDQQFCHYMPQKISWEIHPHVVMLNPNLYLLSASDQTRKDETITKSSINPINFVKITQKKRLIRRDYIPNFVCKT